ncbi:MAG: TauD/TfdA family dioxygenase [Gammaproteobacteria bacterium]|nr:TauD/TfdA family dioxygenase [Gammaproteobacteria bacterium]
MAAIQPTAPDPSSYSAIDVRPLSVHIGAEISGVNIAAGLEPEQVREIWAAMLEWKVVFFRDQPLNHAQHVAFARAFGQCTPAHVVFGGDEEFPEVYSVAKFRTANTKRTAAALRPWSGWHADITAAINPPCASILRGETVPPYGGDTQWTNLAAAYRALSPTLRGFLDTLRGVHRFDAPAGTTASQAYDDKVQSNNLVTEHPLVRVHPETGERSLYVSPSFLKSIVGLSAQESLHMMEMLWEHAVRPEYTVRFKWEPGSIAFWDNRATAHLAPRDIFDSDFERQFYRVTLLGDVPVGVDGTQSTPLEGKPIAAV